MQNCKYNALLSCPCGAPSLSNTSPSWHLKQQQQQQQQQQQKQTNKQTNKQRKKNTTHQTLTLLALWRIESLGEAIIILRTVKLGVILHFYATFSIMFF